MRRDFRTLTGKRPNQRGMTMVDTVITFGIVLIVATGVVELFAMALTSKKPGINPAMQTAEYARYKMDQLLALCANSSSAARNAERSASAGPVRVPGCTDRAVKRTPSLGGSLDIRKPTAQYVDYLDARGNVISATAPWEYVRVWQIRVPDHTSSGTKEIAVKARARRVGSNGVAPEFTIVTTRSFPIQ